MKKLPEILSKSLLYLLLAALAAVFCIMLSTPADERQGESFAVAEETWPDPVTTTQTDSIQTLASVFEETLPYFRGQVCTGICTNATYQNQTARLCEMVYDSCTVYAVMPASAASLLMQEGLELDMTANQTLLNMPCAYASRGQTHCVYFSSSSAAYALLAEDLDEAQFNELLAELTLW